MSGFQLEFTADARDDIKRLYEFLIDIDAAVAERAMEVMESAFDTVCRNPFICRKAADGELGPRWRELLINFGASGYVALFEIENDTTVTITALRHQRESDYH